MRRLLTPTDFDRIGQGSATKLSGVLGRPSRGPKMRRVGRCVKTPLDGTSDRVGDRPSALRARRNKMLEMAVATTDALEG